MALVVKMLVSVVALVVKIVVLMAVLYCILRGREVACSASDRQGSNFESCVWRTVSSQSSHHPQEVLLAQFSLYVHKGGLKPDSFHLYCISVGCSSFSLSLSLTVGGPPVCYFTVTWAGNHQTLDKNVSIVTHYTHTEKNKAQKKRKTARPANTTTWLNIVAILDQRRRRWANNATT